MHLLQHKRSQAQSNLREEGDQHRTLALPLLPHPNGIKTNAEIKD